MAEDAQRRRRLRASWSGVDRGLGLRSAAWPCPRPSAIAGARSSSTLRRLATMRSRISGSLDLGQLEGEGVDDVLLLDAAVWLR